MADVPLLVSEPHKDLIDSDMAAAAEQLMQLSGDEDDVDDSKNNNGQTNMQNKRKSMHTENAAQSKDQSHRTGECLRPKKQRYRSIVHLYMTTKPVNVVYGKKIKS